MIELQSFLNGQQEVYDRFRRLEADVKTLGTTPPKTAESRDGYLIILKHPAEIVERCSDFSGRISHVVPAMAYSGMAVHTTLGVVGMMYRAPEDQGIDSGAVSLLENALHSVSSDFSSMVIPYQGWLYNRESTIAQGIAGKEFVHVADKVHDALQRYDAAQIGKVQQPWGGHITMSRFLETTPADQLFDFFSLVAREPTLPPSMPEAVCLGYISVKNGMVDLQIQASFELRK